MTGRRSVGHSAAAPSRPGQEGRRARLESTREQLAGRAERFQAISQNDFYRARGAKVARLARAQATRIERELREFRPEAVGFGLNYLANIPEVLDLGQAIKRRLPGCFTFAGGHSVSFIAKHVLEQADGALDAVVRGDGEVITPLLLAAA